MRGGPCPAWFDRHVGWLAGTGAGAAVGGLFRDHPWRDLAAEKKSTPVTHTGPFWTISLFGRLAGASVSTERVDAMADGVNRLLNIDALKGFKHFRSFFRQTEPDASYFIFSRKSIACFDSGSEHFQLETVSERSLEQMVPVLEKLGKNNSSRQWFFLWGSSVGVDVL